MYFSFNEGAFNRSNMTQLHFFFTNIAATRSIFLHFNSIFVSFMLLEFLDTQIYSNICQA